MKLIIKTVPEGKQFVIEVDEQSSIKEVKEKISAKDGSSPSTQTLKWQNNILENDADTLNKFGISANFTLTCEIEKNFYGPTWVGRLDKDLIQQLFSLKIPYPEPLMQEIVLKESFSGASSRLKKSKGFLIGDQFSTGKTTILAILAVQSLIDFQNGNIGALQEKLIQNLQKNNNNNDGQKKEQVFRIFILTEQKDDFAALLKSLIPLRLWQEAGLLEEQQQTVENLGFFIGDQHDFYEKKVSFYCNLKYFGADNIEQIYRNSGDKSILLKVIGDICMHLNGGEQYGDKKNLEEKNDNAQLGLLRNKLLMGVQDVRIYLTEKIFSQEFHSFLEVLFKQQNIQSISGKEIGPQNVYFSVLKQQQQQINDKKDNKQQFDDTELIKKIAEVCAQIQLNNAGKSFAAKIIFNPNIVSTQRLEKQIKNDLAGVSFLNHTVSKNQKEMQVNYRSSSSNNNSSSKNNLPLNEKTPVLVINLIDLVEITDKKQFSDRNSFLKQITWNFAGDFENKILLQINLNIGFIHNNNNNNNNVSEQQLITNFQEILKSEYHWIGQKSLIENNFIGKQIEFEKIQDIQTQIVSYLEFNLVIQKQLQFFQQKSKKDALLNLGQLTKKDPSALADALISKAMGGGGNEDSKREFSEKIEQNEAFDAQTKQLLRQRLGGLSSSTEGEKVKNYFQIVFGLPWGTLVQDSLKLSEAEEILNSKHYGMEKAKEAILNFLAVQEHIKQHSEKQQEKASEEQVDKKSTTSSSPPNVICLVGAPGVGKTSLVEVVAEAMHRDCVKIALGGVNNVTHLRGHNYTYVGAKPGAIISAYQRSKSMNPVILLDEIDKISGSTNDQGSGQVASALLEILDPSQNDKFMDHYLDFPVNISQALFICTANDLGSIPGPLRDRMKIIQVPSYSKQEKIYIANNYVIPKVLKTCRLDTKDIQIKDEAIEFMIQNYSPQESGIRKLQEMITEIAQKTVNEIIKKQENEEIQQKKVVSNEYITQIFGIPYKEYDIKNLVKKHGAVVGLATSPSVGGSVKVFESCIYRGKGQLIITSDVGKILTASIQIGIGWIKSNEDYLLKKFGKEISPKMSDNLDKFIEDKLTLNFNFSPATPIDGPSAGIALFTALMSCLTEIQLPSTIAMTGEITLHGMVTAVGGIKQKVSAAIEKGIEKVILSAQNEKQVMEDLTNEQRARVKFYFVETVEEVLEIVFFGNGQ